jgi:hypothetical protein
MYNDSGSFKLAYSNWKRALKGDVGKVVQVLFIVMTILMFIVTVCTVGVLI